MAHPGFGHLWQRRVLSDVVLCVENAATPNQDSAPLGASDNLGAAHTVLQQFPAHRSILTLSPVFEAQMLRWQTDGTAADSSSSSSSKRQFKLTLPDDSYEPAAMAVLAVLYWVKPVREQLAELTPDQLVQAAVLADMWQVPAAGSAAVELLIEAANSAEGLPAAAFDQLLALQALHACLLPVLQQALLSKFGDLEAVLADAALQKALLELPLFAVELLLCSNKLKAGRSVRMAALPPSMLPVLQQALLSRFGDLEAVVADAELWEALLKLPLFAVELLLSSDKVKVTSEDTVLYTAQAYVKRLPTGQRPVAQDRLAPLVRCPHLSRFWLTAAVLSDDAPRLLLSRLQRPLKRLILAQEKKRTKLTAEEIKKDVPDVPASWLLPAHVIKRVSRVEVEWAVDMADIRQAALKAAGSRQVVRLHSPSSAPLQGVTWHIDLKCCAISNSSRLAVYAAADNLPAGTVLPARCTVECVDFVGPLTQTLRFNSTNSSGWRDFFGIGAMSGGFDAAAWAARGLPAEGQLVFKLTVERGK